MKNNYLKLIMSSLILICVIPFSSVQAQTLDDYITRYTGENGPGYIKPAVESISSNMNSGWYRSAKIKKLRPQFYLGVVVMGAFIPEDNKTFRATTEGDFSPRQTVDAPTIVGSGESVTISGDGGTTYTFPGGADINFIPLAAPQLTLGSVFGTDVSVRYVTAPIGGEIGDVTLSGFGIRHSVSQYLPDLFPVDIAINYNNSTAEVGDIMKVKSWIAGVQGSYSIKILNVYGGFAYEKGNADINYTSSEGTNIDFNIDTNANMRATLGLCLNMGPVKLNTDYSIGAQNVLTVGFGIGI
ncbi:DUF6588 family protein [Penaeicola halotolerans]|uniref:DUF6588 family protein n=1 Tax=Penaeicola halotolerans TaxID=2793196 RepID=UPI001CF8C744|nr:DUF6588 family protein [Penaeicola halotolerans]